MKDPGPLIVRGKAQNRQFFLPVRLTTYPNLNGEYGRLAKLEQGLRNLEALTPRDFARLCRLLEPVAREFGKRQ